MPPGSDQATHDGTGRVASRSRPRTVAGTESSQHRDVRVPPGVTVFDAASWNGIAIDSTCGGHGTCQKCKVQIDGRHGADLAARRPLVLPDQIADGWRLACLAQATHDLKVDVPPLMTRPKAATVGVGRQVILRPAIQKRYVELDEPTLSDQRTDLARLTDAIDDLELTVDLHVLRRLPTVLREADFKVTAVVVDDVLIDVEPGDTTARRYAIAFDLGTTTVVATLLDLGTGTPVAVASMLNKQQPFGGDVITRISATMMDPDALGRLQLAAATPSTSWPSRSAARAASTRGGLRGRDRRQRHDDRAGARHRPRAARRRAVRHVHRPAADRTRRRPRPRPAPAGPRVDVPRPRRLRRRRHRRRHARHRHGPRQAHPAVHRRRHQLRDRAQRRRHASCPPPRRPGRPSRAARSGAACAPPTARSRSSS